MMALVGAMWGLHGPAIKLAFAAGFTFPQLVLGEYLVSALVFGAVVWRRGRGAPGSARFWRYLLTAAVFGCGVPLFLFWSYAVGPVPVGATLLFLYVPFPQLLNFVLTRRAPSGREMASAFLVVTGAAVAADFFGAANAETLRGAPQAVAAAFCFAMFFVCTSRIGNDGTPALRSLVCCVTSCVLMLGIAAASGWSLWPAGPESLKTALIWIVVLGVFGQVIPVFLLVNFGPRTGSALGSILTSTELPVAVGVSALVLGDEIGAAQLVGVGLVLAGIALPHLRRREVATTAGDGM
jgi:drug/metabolite transporter (DMT)-like permease